MRKKTDLKSQSQKHKMYNFQVLIIIVSIFLITSCQSKFEKNELLLDFKVKTKSPESLYQVNNFDESVFVDKPRNINVLQIQDTLFTSFEIFEGAAVEIEGNIELKGDSLILKIWKGQGVRELVIDEYEYKIYNPESKEFQILIESVSKIEDL
jgi:hypothetical protein